MATTAKVSITNICAWAALYYLLARIHSQFRLQQASCRMIIISGQFREILTVRNSHALHLTHRILLVIIHFVETGATAARQKALLT